MATFKAMILVGYLLLFGAGVEIASGIWAGGWGGFFLHLLCGLLHAVSRRCHPRPARRDGAGLHAYDGGLLRGDRLDAGGVFPHAPVFRLGMDVLQRADHVRSRNHDLAALASDALWVIGLFVGIDLIFIGWSWVMLAFALKSLPATTPRTVSGVPVSPTRKRDVRQNTLARASGSDDVSLLEPRMTRFILLIGIARAAFIAAYGAVKLIDHQSAPPGMVWIPGGEFTMGTDDPESSRRTERPAHRVRVDGFWMDETDVTNAQFRKFVEATGYVTTAEKAPTEEEIMQYAMPGAPPPKKEDLVAGSVVFTPPDHPVDLRDVSQLVEMDARRELAAPRRPRQLDRGQGRSSGRPRLLVRRRGLRQVGRQAAADRGRVGVRRPRRTGRQEVRLGRRAISTTSIRSATTSRATSPIKNTAKDGYARTSPVQGVPAQRLRPVRHGRQRLAVVQRLVSARRLSAHGRLEGCSSIRKAQTTASTPSSGRRSGSTAAGRSSAASATASTIGPAPAWAARRTRACRTWDFGA